MKTVAISLSVLALAVMTVGQLPAQAEKTQTEVVWEATIRGIGG
jgi:hypothetical protein